MPQVGRPAEWLAVAVLVCTPVTMVYAQPASPGLVAYIDAPRATGSCGGLPMPCPRVAGVAVAAGWALDVRSQSGSGVSRVEIRVDGVLQPTSTLRTGIARPDVAAVYGRQFLNTGWEAVVSFAGLAASNPPERLHLLDIRVVSSVDGGYGGGAIFIDVAPPLVGHVDVPQGGAAVTSPVVVGGWTADSTYRAGTGISAVRVYDTQGGAPVLVATATYGGVRPDVAAAYASPFFPDWYHAGWSASVPLSPGTHVLQVRALTISGAEQDFPGNSVSFTVR
jgi:hypothetical protein